MLHKIKFLSELAVANRSGAMEAESISKNGHSSKSQKSRENFLKFIVSVFLSCIILFGCNKDDDNGVGSAKGYVEVDGEKIPIHKCSGFITSHEGNLYLYELNFESNDEENYVRVKLIGSSGSEIADGTYNTEKFPQLSFHVGFKSVDVSDKQMVIKKSGNDYDFTLTFKDDLGSSVLNYKMTYKGTVELKIL